MILSESVWSVIQKQRKGYQKMVIWWSKERNIIVNRLFRDKWTTKRKKKRVNQITFDERGRERRREKKMVVFATLDDPHLFIYYRIHSTILQIRFSAKIFVSFFFLSCNMYSFDVCHSLALYCLWYRERGTERKKEKMRKREREKEYESSTRIS